MLGFETCFGWLCGLFTAGETKSLLTTLFQHGGAAGLVSKEKDRTGMKIIFLFLYAATSVGKCQSSATLYSLVSSEA